MIAFCEVTYLSSRICPVGRSYSASLLRLPTLPLRYHSGLSQVY